MDERLATRLVPRRRTFGVLLILASSAPGGLVGCGGAERPPSLSTYPVSGKVLLEDGKPLNGGQVVFMPKGTGGIGATGAIGPDGGFTLGTYSEGDGAAEGDYLVRIEPDPSQVTTKGRKNVLPFPGRYADEDVSGLTASIKPQPNQLEPFTLKKK